MGKSEIEELDNRLRRSQITLGVVMSFVSSGYQKEHNVRLTKLQKQGELHRLNQERQFSELRRLLVSIRDQVLSLRSIDLRSGSESLEEVERLLRELQTSRPAVLKVFSQADIAEVEGRMRDLNIGTNDQEKQQAIIGSLNFANRPARHGAIPAAHAKTFQWAFDTNCDEGKNCKGLMSWLRSGSGIFWVSGRPGSGKSTFMKYLAGQEETQAVLNLWSSPGEAIVSSHYFWIFGTSLQKSWEGFLRSVLFEIFQQCPSLLPYGCSDRWASKSPGSWSGPWSLSELRKTLQARTSHSKGLLFIDGLDEYDGDHLEVIEDMGALTLSANIKACVSSRSWNVFHDAFAHNELQRLYIHELTKGDIRHYVQDRLVAHPRWSHLTSWTDNADQLIQDVADRSHGVFLWVFLVTKLLRNGLTNDDTLADLSRRLATFPSDLESFFDHIIQSVESFYHEKMAGTLMIANATKAPLHILFYEFHDREHDDQDYSLHMPVCPLGRQQLSGIESRVKRRINAYCKGLLEVHDHRVVFLHRTVADFLNQRAILCRLQEKCPSWFRPELSCARAHLGIMKTCDFWGPHGRGITLPTALCSHVTSVMTFSAPLDQEPGELRDKFYSLLEEVETTMCWRPKEGGIDSHQDEKLVFRELLVQSNNPNYIDEALKKNPAYFGNFEYPPLHLLLLDGSPTKHMDTFRILLGHGQEPNEEYDEQSGAETSFHGQTPWSKLLSLAILQSGDTVLPSLLLPPFSKICRSGLLTLFLRYGANPNALTYRQETGRRSRAWLDISFACFKISICDEAPYLDLLEQIAKMGVPCLVGSSGEAQLSPAILKRFFRTLHERTRSSAFALQVSEKVIRMAYSSGCDIESTWHDIQEALSMSQLQRLRQMYHGFEQERQGGIVESEQEPRTKRPYSSTGDNEDRRKRPALRMG
ncbi:nacht nucleoside triphosphatase [Apiospora arundinis]|uniref:Nacht nucleoside triphosphatase n=1 Tax=Apiospora arundinis TaxID=335852 RepID=A0ABR2I960_9PEZI